MRIRLDLAALAPTGLLVALRLGLEARAPAYPPGRPPDPVEAEVPPELARLYAVLPGPSALTAGEREVASPPADGQTPTLAEPPDA